MTSFSFRDRAKSFRYAFAGLGFMVRTQHNAWLHAAATIGAVGAGLAWGITGSDWKWLILTIAAVWVAETMNTAFEHLCDVVSPEHHDSVKLAKDVAAAAVLICAIAAVVMGWLIFGPYLLGDRQPY